MPIDHLLGQDFDVCLQQGEIDILRPISEVVALLCKTAVIIEIPLQIGSVYLPRQGVCKKTKTLI